jgi:hypothetical protein
MNKIKAAIAFTLLAASPALGQGLPIDLTLPPGTVIGRPSAVGPGQATAITFAQLAAALGPGRVKTFFILQNYTQPGVIHVDATI